MTITYTTELHNHIQTLLNSQCHITCVFQGGSALFVDNPHDIDLVVLSDDFQSVNAISDLGFAHLQFKWEGQTIDCFVWNTQIYIQRFYESPPPFVPIAYLWVQKYTEYIYFGTLPKTDNLNWDKIFNTILYQRYERLTKSRKRHTEVFNEFQTGYIQKSFYWDWLLMCIIQNQELKFSGAQLYTAQLLHDRIVDLSIVEHWFEFTQQWLKHVNLIE